MLHRLRLIALLLPTALLTRELYCQLRFRNSGVRLTRVGPIWRIIEVLVLKLDMRLNPHMLSKQRPLQQPVVVWHEPVCICVKHVREDRYFPISFDTFNNFKLARDQRVSFRS